MQNTKRYWLRFGSVFFVIGFVLISYSAYFVVENTASFLVTGQPHPFDFKDYLHFIPGVNYLASFAYGGPVGIIIGVIILSLLYGLFGAIIGGIYGKIKNRGKVTM